MELPFGHLCQEGQAWQGGALWPEGFAQGPGGWTRAWAGCGHYRARGFRRRDGHISLSSLCSYSKTQTRASFLLLEASGEPEEGSLQKTELVPKSQMK